MDGEPAPDTFEVSGYVGELKPKVNISGRPVPCGPGGYMSIMWERPEELRTDWAILTIMNNEGRVVHQERIANSIEGVLGGGNPAQGLYQIWCTLPPGHYYVRLVAVK